MSTDPADDSSENSSSTSISGGVNVDAQHDVHIGGDVVGRDKIMNAGDDIVLGDQVEAETYIEHATIIHDRTNRIWLAALAGVIGVIVIVLGIVATRQATAPVPVLTVVIPTNEPTATSLPNTPTPTATPIFARNVPYRVAIAKFNQLSDRKLAIEQRLEDDLDQKLQAAGLSDEVEVKIVSQPVIESIEQAQEFVESTQSNVLVWGLYDDVGIRLRISLGSSASPSPTLPEVARFGELQPTSSETGTLSFYITSTLPANTSFLSFYVIGHLYYLSNQYAKGHVAFDTAMQQLPRTVQVENEALLNFFTARVMDTTTTTGTVKAICTYAQAIALDNHMFEAYNNLGILTNEDSGLFRFLSDSDHVQIETCANKASITLNARELFSMALRLRPDLGIAQYNLGTLDWNTKANCDTDVNCEHRIDTNQDMLQKRERAESEFVAALKSDPSITGAYLGLGNMAMWRGNFVTATEQFSTALSLMPQSPDVAFNLGQALASADREQDAEAAYRQAIRTAPQNSGPSIEAHLALGNLYHRQGDLARAGTEYQQAQAQLQQAKAGDSYWMPGTARLYLEGALDLALAHYEIDTGEVISASQRAHDSIDFSQLHFYLSWLIDSAHGLTATVASEVFYTVTADYETAPFIAWSYGDVAAMAWYDLVKQCKTSAQDDFRTWGSSANLCLPAAPQKRLDAVFEIIQRRMQQRLFFTDVVPAGGMACPYLFTYDDQSRQWSIDTTILYKLIGPQAETIQARRLSRFNGQLLLREVEAETSYVDMIAVRLIAADGREILLKLDDPLLGITDGHYLILHQGDQRLLTFAVPEGALPAREAWIVAAGYYLPVEH